MSPMLESEASLAELQSYRLSAAKFVRAGDQIAYEPIQGQHKSIASQFFPGEQVDDAGEIMLIGDKKLVILCIP